MRYLFFLVLLANVIFYFWHWRSEALKPISESASVASDYEHQIYLLTEVQPEVQQAKSPSELPSASEKAHRKIMCYEVGPFENKQEILDWDKQNPIRAENIVFHFKDVEVVDGYLLYYPAPATLALAEDNVAILEAKGVKDLWLFRFGDMKGAISLGFYDTAQQAIHAQEALEKIGVDAKIKKHVMVKKHIFVQISWKPEGHAIKELLADFQAKYPDKSLLKCQGLN